MKSITLTERTCKMEITLSQLEAIIAVMREFNRPLTIDWDNRKIAVLSAVKVNPKVRLSDGPLKYRNYHFVKEK